MGDARRLLRNCDRGVFREGGWFFGGEVEKGAVRSWGTR